MHTLRCVSTNDCVRLGKLQQVRWCTLNTFEISFKYVVNTLLHVGIRRIDPKILYLHKNLQRMSTYCLYARHKLDIRNG